jgi:hypothetical protein
MLKSATASATADSHSKQRACFTENYLVFSLNERMPQITEIYLDKEDDLLDYSKRVIFAPAATSNKKRNATAKGAESLLQLDEEGSIKEEDLL